MRRSSSSYGPAGLAASLRRVVASIDPNQPVYGSTEMKALIGDSIEDKRFITMLLTATGVLALLLAAAGIYAALSSAISRGTLGNNTAAVVGLALALVTVTALLPAPRPPAARRGSIQWPR